MRSFNTFMKLRHPTLGKCPYLVGGTEKVIIIVAAIIITFAFIALAREPPYFHLVYDVHDDAYANRG